MKKILKIAAAAVLLTACTLTCRAELLQYFTRDLVATNQAFNGGSVITNLASYNYPTDGKGCSLNAINPNSQYSQAVLLELETGEFIGTNTVATARASTTGTLYLAPVFDDAALVNLDPIATNNLVSVTFTVPAYTSGYVTKVFNGTTNALVPAVTNVGTTLISVPATNFLGAKSFFVYGVSYTGTNQLGVKRIKAGYYTFSP